MDAKLETSNLIAPILSAFKALSDEWSEFIETGLSDYIYSQTNKYYYTNTFIHRNEKVKFDDIYYPIKAKYGHLTTDFSGLESVLDEYKCITIIGSAGSGKTTLIKYIFLNAISLRSRIPILIELRNLNAYQGNFEKLISEKILESRIKPSSRIFKRTLQSGKFLFLLDGYDEIFSDKKQEINRQLELFIDTYSENRFVLTTRPGSGVETFPRFRNFNVVSLSENDVVQFIDKIVENKERKARIIDIVNSPENSNYLEFLKNPLLLSMFILAFESHPEIPGKKNAFYRNVFDTLYSKHDGITKNSFPREKLTKLKRDDFEKILCLFSYFTLLEGKYAFTYEYMADVLEKVNKYYDYDFSTDDLIYDLHTSISVVILDGFEYSFPHRSMQEYFTALFISRLDSDKRSKAYNNLATALEESSEDYSFTFWSLCYELDETNFITSFLMPKLKYIYDILDKKEDKALIRAYNSFAHPIIFAMSTNISQNLKKKGKEYTIFPETNVLNSVLEFCDNNNQRKVWSFILKTDINAQLCVISDELKEKVEFNNPLVFDLIYKCKFADLIIEIKNSILEKIKQWEQSIAKEKHNIDDLLSG